MLKKISYGFIVAAIIAAIIYLFLQLPTFNRNKNSVYACIPSNSILLIKGNSPKKLRKNLEKASAIWTKLQGVDIFNLINELLTEEADLVDKEERLRPILEEKQIIITINKVNERFEPLVFLDIEDDKYIAYIDKMYEQEKRIVQRFDLEGETGFTVQDRAKRKWHVIVKDHILIIAFDKSALKDAILNIKLKKTLLFDKGFEQANNVSGNTDIVCLINNREIYHLNNYLFKPAYFNRNIWSVKQQDWTTVDFTFAPNEVKFSSIWLDKDSTSIWNFLKRNETIRLDYLKHIPNNTFGFSTIELDDYEMFYDKSIERFDEERNQIQNRYFNALAKSDKQNTANKFKGLLKGRFINVKTKIDTIGFSELSLIEIKDTNQLTQLLDNISDTIIQTDIKIFKLRKDDLFNKLCFNYLQSPKAAYLTVVYPYLVFSNHIGVLQDYKVLINDNKNVFNDKAINAYLTNKFQNNSMFFAFERWHNLEFSKMDWLNEKNYDRAREYMKFLRLMDFSGVQMAYKNNHVIMQGNIQTYNDAESDGDKGLLWQKNLDANIKQVKIVYNQKTQSNDLFVEDKSNQVYLYNSNGMLLWKKSIDDSIIGEVSTVDWFKNKKTQLFFNTATSIYCLDINGDNVATFPVGLKEKAANQASLFDYDSDNNYRMLYMSDKKTLQNVTLIGNAPGFKSFETDAMCYSKVSFVRADNKDHLVLIDTIGCVYLLDRKGNLIRKLQNHIKYDKRLQLSFSNKLSQSKIYYVNNKQLAYVSLLDELDMQAVKADDLELIKHNNQVLVRYIEGKRIGLLNAQLQPLFAFESNNEIDKNIWSFSDSDTLCHVVRYVDNPEALFLYPNRQYNIPKFPRFEAIYFYSPTEDLKYFVKTEGNQLKCYYFAELN